MNKQAELNADIAQLELELAELKAKKRDLRTIRTTWYVHGSYTHGEHMEVMGLTEDDIGPNVNFGHALYEVAVDVEVDLETGEYKILEVRENGQVLVPKETA